VAALTGGLICVLAHPMAVGAQSAIQNVKGSKQLTFDIPAQPLADALYAYTAATGVEALASGTLLVSRRSSEVRGTLAADEALHKLLAGTGLTARFVDSGSFTLAPTQSPLPAASLADGPSDIPPFAAYSAMVQSAAKRALCRRADTRPGYYRTAIQIWIAPSGMVTRAVLVGTTGDPARDKTLSDLFGTLSIGVPPPPGLPQPATLLILPRTQASDCTSAARAGAP
jgi:hypothetical protein